MQTRLHSRCRLRWTQSQCQAVCFAYSEAAHVCQYHGPARNKPQFHIAAPKLRLFHWMPGEWTGYRPWAYGLCHRCARTSSSGRPVAKKVKTPRMQVEAHQQRNRPFGACPTECTRFQARILICFEDDGAEIMMIIKGRSPTSRHVSRTHRVDLDWLSDWIKDPETILSVFTPTLTKDSFSRER